MSGIINIQSRETLISKRKELKMGSKKNNRNNDSNLAQLVLVNAIITLLNGLITLITKLIDLLSD